MANELAIADHGRTTPDPRGGPSAHGAALGLALAGLADDGYRVAPETKQRCGCCAFRLGSMPNQCASTVSDALAALTEGETDFMCHHGLDEHGVPTRPCGGYAAATHVSLRRFQARLKLALAAMPDGEVDPVRTAYTDWLRSADPENHLDDYERAALYAQWDGRPKGRDSLSGSGSADQPGPAKQDAPNLCSPPER